MRSVGVALLLIAIPFIMVFCSLDNKPDLEGEWEVRHLIISGEDQIGDVPGRSYAGDLLTKPDTVNKLFIGADTIKLYLDGYKPVTGKLQFLDHAYLKLHSASRQVFDSDYHIEMKSQKSNTGSKIRDVTVTLSSDNIKMILHRSEQDRNVWLRENNDIRNYRRSRP